MAREKKKLEDLTGEELFGFTIEAAASERGGHHDGSGYSYSLKELKGEFLRRLEKGEHAKRQLETASKGPNRPLSSDATLESAIVRK